MPVTIGSNIAALLVTRQLDRTSAGLGRIYERLAGGVRIVRASDDAAGLSVATELNNGARVYSRGQQNLSDAISLVNIADGTLNQVSLTLTRMIELSEQAANGTFSRTQLNSLDREFQTLNLEIRRIGSTTNFNGLNLLQGKKSARSAQVVDTDSTDSAIATFGISANGRYEFYSKGLTPQYYLRDTVTGDSRNIDAIVRTGSTGVLQANVQNNGDIIFLGTNTSTSAIDVFKVDASSGTLRQLTNDKSFNLNNKLDAVSADGSTIVFTSGGTDYSDLGSASSAVSSGTIRRFVLDVESGVIHRDNAKTLAAYTTITLSADGRQLAASDGTNLTKTTIGTSSLSFSTTTPGGSVGLVGNRNDGSVVFTSNANITGQNGSLLTQFFIQDASGSAYQQVGNFTSAISSTNTVLSTDGTLVSFFSTANPLGENSSGVRQAFQLDLGIGAFRQLTQFSSDPFSGNKGRFLSSDGSRLLASTNAGDQLLDLDLTAAASSFDFEAGFGSRGNIVLQFDGLTRALRGLSANTLTSQVGARSALEDMTAALQNLNQLRGTIGAGQSRLSIGVSVLGTLAQEYRSAEGRIRDVDVAAESSNLIRLGILQQAGAAVLAQARQAPALAVSLLR